MIIKEGEALFEASTIISKKAEIFYNKQREKERTINVAVAVILSSSNLLPKDARGLDMLAGSGVRGIRLLKESGVFSSIDFNDIRTWKVIKENLQMNNLQANVFNSDAKKLVVGKYDYIDIDPFGSPIPFFATAIMNARINTILGITATDLAALYGIAKSSKRKYWFEGIKTSYLNEIGIRVLLTNLERIANIYNFSVEPLLYFAEHHYIRTYIKLSRYKAHKIGYIFQCKTCPYRTTEEMKKCKVCGGEMKRIGPIWLDAIANSDLSKKLATYLLTKMPKEAMYFAKEANEGEIPWYFTTDELARFTKTQEKKLEFFIEKGALPTPLNSKGFKISLPAEEVIQLAQAPVG